MIYAILKEYSLHMIIQQEFELLALFLAIIIAKLKNSSKSFLSKFKNIFRPDPNEDIEMVEFVEIFHTIVGNKAFQKVMTSIKTAEELDVVKLKAINKSIAKALPKVELTKLQRLKNFMRLGKK